MALRGDDDPRDVEFLAVTDTRWDVLDDDAAFRRPEPLGPPGVRRAVIAAAVVVIGGALVLRTATSHDVQRHPSAAATASVIAPDAPAVPSGPDPAIVGQFNGAALAARGGCAPSGESCVVSDTVPSAFLTAVRAMLGTVAPTQQVDMSAVSAGTSRPLWYRHLGATGQHGVTITITISKISASISTSSVTQSPTAVTGQVTHPTGTGYLVEIEMKGPVGWRPPMDAMTALAADPRLIVSSPS